MNARRSLTLIGAALAAVLAQSSISTPDEPFPIGRLLPVFELGPAEKDRAGWYFTDASAWDFREVDGSLVLDQARASAYEPPVRSPFNFALLPNLELTDFVLDLEARSTAREYGHRDICLIFGYQDAQHLAYCHIASAADEHAHSVFAVDAQPRVSIALDRTRGVAWTEGWHHVRLVRVAATGTISVYFDDMLRPVMVARESRFAGGRLGFGTFDDTAQFRRVKVWGRKVPAAH